MARCVVTLARHWIKAIQTSNERKEENLLLCDNKKLLHVTPLILDDVILLNTISIKREEESNRGSSSYSGQFRSGYRKGPINPAEEQRPVFHLPPLIDREILLRSVLHTKTKKAGLSIEN